MQAPLSNLGRFLIPPVCRQKDEERKMSYVFDNAGPQATQRFRALEAIFDPGSQRMLLDLGVEPGWSCLEVGGGSGSIAAWLSERVGRDGHVLATDIDTRHLKHLGFANLTVQDHDIRHAPLPANSFDLVHMRLVLMHLPNRHEVLERLASALKPGGWLVVEDFDSLSLPADPEINPAESALPTLTARLRVMSDHGLELRCGRLLDGWFRRLGLADIGSEGRVFMWRGGSSGADHMRANIEQLRTEIVGSGLASESEFQQDLMRLSQDEFAFPSPIMWAAWGRRL
jgi:ubiquinone/menaquinone biosynthesis C-methylase UbiE